MISTILEKRSYFFISRLGQNYICVAISFSQQYEFHICLVSPQDETDGIYSYDVLCQSGVEDSYKASSLPTFFQHYESNICLVFPQESDGINSYEFLCLE